MSTGTNVVEQEETGGEKFKVLAFLLIAFVLIMAEIGLMDYSLFKAPVVIQMIYDKVTLPSALHFIGNFKWLFQFLMFVVCCIPAVLLLGATGAVMSRVASKE